MQLNLFEFIDDKDPIFLMMKNVEMGESVNINEFEVKRNSHNLYEVTSTECHESFSDINSCYKWIISNTENKETLY